MKQNVGEKFTIIELLVVIAIILILVSLLLPALKSAREKANSIACSGNLKTIVLGAINYSNDYDDFALPNRGDLDGAERVWYIIGWSYITGKPNRRNYGASGLFVDSSPVLYCGTSTLKYEKDFLYHSMMCYGINKYVGLMIQNPDARKLLKMTSIKSASSKFYFTEKRHTQQDIQDLSAFNFTYPPSFRHGSPYLDNINQGEIFASNPGFANTAFFDGHVQGFRYKNFKANGDFCFNLP